MGREVAADHLDNHASTSRTPGPLRGTRPTHVNPASARRAGGPVQYVGRVPRSGPGVRDGDVGSWVNKPADLLDNFRQD